MTRAFSEIKADVDIAVRNDDVESLDRLINEIDSCDHDDRCLLLSMFARGVAYSLRGEMDASIDQYNLALTQAQRLGEDRLTTVIIGNLANVHHVSGQHSEAKQLYLQSLSLHVERGEQRDIARLLSNLASVAAATGAVDEARDYATQSLDAFTVLNDVEGQGRARILLGIIERNGGNDNVALSQLRSARDIFSSVGNALSCLKCDTIVSEILMARGLADEAYIGFMRALDDAIRLGSAIDEVDVRGHISEIFSSNGDYVSAIEQSERALAVLHGRNLPFLEAQHQNALGLSYQRSGDRARARVHFMRALDLLGGDGPLAPRASVTMNLADLAAEEQQWDDAISNFGKALDIARALGRADAIALGLGNLVHALFDSGETSQARSCLVELDDLSVQDIPARILQHLAHAKLQRLEGNIVDSHNHAEKALHLAEQHQIRGLAITCHEVLRDLAKQTMDFATFIKHSDAAQQISNETRGAEMARRLTLREAEQSIARERAETERHRTLLYSTLPKSVADRVLQGESVNDSIEHGAIMFMDLVGFTAMSAAMSPNDVVALLSKIFTTCDGIISTNGLLKIKTIGDSYMAAALEGEAVFAAATTAIALIIVMQQQFPDIQVRIGIHCGPVTAGVIGTERLQYDVWGDTVNVASRMESTGEPGRIHVSEAFADALRSAPYHNFTLTERGTIDVKGKGAMMTYWLEGA